MSLAPCCFQGFKWGGTPTGCTSKLADKNTYITGDNTDVAVLLVHDAFGWTYPNIRLLADHFAQEIDATVYVPDFFNGEVLPFEPLANGEWDRFDFQGFMQRHTREAHEHEIFEAARALKQKYKKLGAIGYCFGGWAVFRLGAKEHQPALVDCITAGHPSLLTKQDINEISVPVQVLAPEHDPMYTAELKLYTFETIPKLHLPLDYQHFPGVEHACLTRGNEAYAGELDAMVREKNAAVGWLKQFLHASSQEVDIVR